MISTLRYIFFTLLCTVMFTLPSFSQRTQFTKYDSLRGVNNNMRNAWDVTSYDLQLFIDIPNKQIDGAGTIRFTALREFTEMQIDLFSYYAIDSIVHEGKKLSFDRDSHFVYLDLPLTTKGEQSSVKVYYHGKPQIAAKPPWDGGFVWEKDSLDKPWVGVACEGLGASSWWPCKDYPADEPDSISMRFTVPADLMCVANGDLETVTPKNIKGVKYKEWVWKVSYPINLYNVTLNIADYVQISDTYLSKVDGEKLRLDYYVLRYNETKARAHFKQVVPMLDCYEKLFGKYPFYRDGFALVETSYWGMEHQGAIAYGNHYKNNIADWDYIIIHESGHEWWGNSVSCADHAELWIHESFCTYTEALLMECSYGYNAYMRYLDYNKKRFSNQEPILGLYNVNYNYWEDSDMYYKGAWMLHTLRTMIGDDALWFSILKGIQEKYRISIVTSNDIIQYINQRTGKDYTLFFKQYLEYSSVPEIQYYVKKKGKKYILHYSLVSDVRDLRLNVTFATGNSSILKVDASSEWKEATLTKEEAYNLKFMSDYYLINAAQVKPNH